MKKINQLLKHKEFRKTVLDEKTVFYIFKKIIKHEYGKKGEENLVPDFYKNGKLFIKTQSSNWASEAWVNRQDIIKKINQELNTKEVKGIKIIK
ncbi:hypothetical protein BMS3Abin15_00791 [bacterium BMS3Abin15]|nr:hypothetical protein BMS3Abin15_00791 [bacterium BMS3Abin15]HDH07616.1 DUF721 domain-containing protein [Candidatus Moranbacteria bacterium]HDZ85613.1 DUF721 domain-containing protein [Candidatus Moranbacteria bacterium]